jgi:predicted AAA+ superfamily ATPase
MSVSEDSRETSFEKYLPYGGLPYLMSMPSEEQKAEYLKSLFTETYMKDIKDRYGIRRDDEMRELVSILSSGIGGLTSPLTLSKTFKSVKHVNITDDTISNYIDSLCDAFLIERSERYDVKGRKYIGSPLKYYFTDLGLRNASINFRQDERTHLVGNAVYNELRTRGFNVDVGVVPVRKVVEDGTRKLISYEVDFVCNLGNRRYYVQSAYRMPSDEKIAQEKNSLIHIDDSFKKIIVLGEPSLIRRDDNGITTMSIYDFLLNENSLDF